jgi:hypothetical protein
MSDVRCRACGAAVPSDAQWCSLCFADLREPAPVRERVSVTAAAADAEPSADQAAAALNGARPDPDALLGLSSSPAAATETAEAPVSGISAVPALAKTPPEAAKWPCGRCGAKVPISMDDCPSCGAGFLSGASSPMSSRLPLVGDVGRFSRNQRIGLGFGFAIVLMVVLVALLTIGGHIF